MVYQGECADMEVYKYSINDNYVAFYRGKHFTLTDNRAYPTNGWAGIDGGRRLKAYLQDHPQDWAKIPPTFEIIIKTIAAYLRNDWES
jgi:hypothetical protein